MISAESEPITVRISAAPIRPRLLRLTAAAVLVGLGLAGLVLAPMTAADGFDLLPYRQGQPAWLAGVLDSLGDWWHGLSLGQQLLIGVGIAALIALSGGSLALAFGVAGVATWGLDKSHGIATFTRDPEHATVDYFTTATFGQYLADTLGVALTFAPGNFAGAAIGRGFRSTTTEFAHNPGAFMGRRRTALQNDAGSAPVSTHGRGRAARQTTVARPDAGTTARGAGNPVDRSALRSDANNGRGWHRAEDGSLDPEYNLQRTDAGTELATRSRPAAEASPEVARLGGDASRP